MWICTKCETYNEETSLVCCVCGNRRGAADAKCETTRLESNFKSSMENSDQNTDKKPDPARIPKPARETYKIKEGQESAEIPDELRPEEPPADDIVDEADDVPDFSIMPELAPFSDNNENPFGGAEKREEPPVPAPEAPGEAAPVPAQAPSAGGSRKKIGLALLVFNALLAVGVVTAVVLLLK